jgi:cell wall-associated NlpC family hydrolase
MIPVISTAADAIALRAEAMSWFGTPWVGNGVPMKGTGASCGGLPFAILQKFGHEGPEPFDRADVSKSESLERIAHVLDDHPAFFYPINLTGISAGDVLLFYAGIGHIGLALDANEMVHSWQKGGVHVASFREKQLLKRLRRAWRPIK